MSNSNIGRDRGFLALSICLFLFALFSLPAYGATPEIEAIREQIKNKGARWIADETSMTRLSEEQRLHRLGLIKPSSKDATAVVSTEIPSVSVPAPYLNYNDPPYYDVTPVRNQGNCGSCWAFAATGALESQVLMATRATPSSVDLSEQVLVSCSGAGSCNGGYADSASFFIQEAGLPVESCFPYTAKNTKCSAASCPYWQSNTDGINGWIWVTTTSPTVDTIKSALLTYGPLVTTMNVYSDFDAYAGGVYYNVSGKLEGAHAILLVGYDDANRCFIVKNSWGTDWGEAGFFRIDYNALDDSKVQFGYYTIAYTGYKALQNSCSYTITPDSATVPAAGGKLKVSVSSQMGCTYTAVSNTGWIKVISGKNGTSNGTVKFQANPNYSSKRRTGTVTIGGQTLTVTQKK